MRAYLLGDLNDTNAASLEQSYFSDPVLFEWMWGVEEELIGDYIAGRLTPAERKHFESRYLKVPALNKRFEEVRNRVGTVPRESFRMRWVVVCTGVLVLCCGLIWFGLRSHGGVAQQVAANRPLVPAAAVLAIRLTPGLQMGPQGKQVELAPPKDGKVRLSFELPGIRAAMECQVRLTVVGAGSQRQTLWTSGILQTEEAAGGQEAHVELESAQVPAADYVAEVRSAKGDVLETYSFRVTWSH